MNWGMVSAFTALCVFQGAILLAAAKSLFVTKKQIFDVTGTPYFVTFTELDRRLRENHRDIVKIGEKVDVVLAIVVPRPEWESSKTERDLRYATQQESLCKRMEDLVISFTEMHRGQAEISRSLTEIQTIVKTLPQRRVANGN